MDARQGKAVQDQINTLSTEIPIITTVYFGSEVTINPNSQVNYRLHEYYTAPDGYYVAAAIARTSYSTNCHKLNVRVIFSGAGYIFYYTNDSSDTITTLASADIILCPLSKL